MNRKRAAIVAVGLLATLAVVGCGDAPGGPARSDEVVFWHSMGDDLGRVLGTLVDRFNEGRTGPKIKPQYQGDYSYLKQKIHMALKAGEPPDLAQQYESWTAYYNLEKGREAMLALDPFIAEEKDFDLEDFYPVFVEDNRWDGKIWSFPCTKSLPVLYFNKDLFRKAGLDPDRPPATWEEFAEAGRKLSADHDGDGTRDVWGWSFVVDPWIIECMVLQQGAKLANSDDDILPLTRPEYEKALGFHLDAVRGEGAFATLSTGREFQNDFVAQRAAMIITTSVSKAFMVDRIRFEFGMAPLPSYGPPVTIMAGTNVGIFRQSPPEKQRVAWEFIKFFCSPEITAFWARNTGYVPVRRSAVESPEFQEYLKKDPTARAAITLIPHATFEPRSPVWYDIRDQVGRAIEKTLRGEGSIAENLRWATDKIQETLRATRR